MFTDPTGHCVEQYDKTEAGCRSYLKDHGWVDLVGNWAYDELQLFVASIQDLKRAMGWLQADYTAAMTGGKYKLRATIADVSSEHPNYTAETGPESDGFINMIIYRKKAFYNDDGGRKDTTTIKGTFVHEQAHAWDSASGDKLSSGLSAITHGLWVTDTGRGAKTYTTADPMPSSGGPGGPKEDWADTVMAMVYDDHYRVEAPVSTLRSDYVHAAANSVSP